MKESVVSHNDLQADMIRNLLTAAGTFFMNVMSSPESGKTTTLVALINRLKETVKIA